MRLCGRKKFGKVGLGQYRCLIWRGNLAHGLPQLMGSRPDRMAIVPRRWPDRIRIVGARGASGGPEGAADAEPARR